MLTETQKAWIIRRIPNEVTVDNVAFKAGKRYGNQFEFDMFPAIVLTYAEQSNFMGHWPILNNKRRWTNQTKENVRYRNGVLVYILTVDQPDMLVSVTGTVAGSAYSFGIGDTRDVYVNSSRELEFTGATLPDADTLVLVEYTHRTVRLEKGNEVNDRLTVDIWAEDYDDRADGAGPYVNGVKIVNALTKVVHEWFRYVEDIYDDAGDRVDVTFKTEAIRNLDDVVESNIRRLRQFEVYIAHIEGLTEQIPSVETVEWEFGNVYP